MDFATGLGVVLGVMIALAIIKKLENNKKQ